MGTIQSDRSQTYTTFSTSNIATTVGFFIPVSSLKVFGHSIHSERRMIYRGKSIQALQNDTLSYHGYSVSGSSSQQCGGTPLKLLCLFS